MVRIVEGRNLDTPIGLSHSDSGHLAADCTAKAAGPKIVEFSLDLKRN